MKRPIVFAVIGYLIGIIFGLYFNFSIALLYLLLISITFSIKSFILFFKILKFKIDISSKESIYNLLKNSKPEKKKFSFYSIKRYLRYFKIIFNRKVIILIIIFSCLSNFIIIEKNKKFESFYKMEEQVELIAKIISNVKEKDYKNIYKIQIIEINKYKKDECLYLITDKKQQFKYGDIVKINGNYKAPDSNRNYGGFNYQEYLKTLEIYGTITAKSIQKIKDSQQSDIGFFMNKIKENIKQNTKEILDKDTYSIYLGLVLGDTSNIEDEVLDNFRNSSMSHILAVSGMHITYILMGTVYFLSKISGKKNAKILCILVLVIYIAITGFSPSIIRASCISIIMLFAGIINRKADTWTSIAISLFIILIYNPYLILNIGLQFSYMGTIGIILLGKNIIKLLNFKKKSYNYKISKFKILKNEIKQKDFIKFTSSKIQKLKLRKIKTKNKKQSKIRQIIAVTISVQIFILPLNILNFNTFGIYFLITNLILSLIIGPVIIVGFILLICILLKFSVASFFAIPIKLGIKAIIFLTNIGNLPFSKIYVRTPAIIELIIYYLTVIILNFVYKSKTSTNPSNSNLRVKYMIQLFKYNYIKYKKKVISAILVLVLMCFSFILFIPKSLKIHFVDVGQGDCCFIETPENQTILIDGGGNEFGEFDVGESVLLPYILDRGYTKIDYIIISHFDSDHVQGILTILKELQVKNVLISKQKEESKNYKDFIEIVNKKKIKVNIIKKGDRVKIENDLYCDIIWPNEKNLITENALNNNSIVCKLIYKDFSMLFTGDIEEIAEKEILKENETNIKLQNSDVLKIAHHGSKTSTTKEFLEIINPKVALIGVGQNNKFGHPNQEILQRLQLLRHSNI